MTARKGVRSLVWLVCVFVVVCRISRGVQKWVFSGGVVRIGLCTWQPRTWMDDTIRRILTGPKCGEEERSRGNRPLLSPLAVNGRHICGRRNQPRLRSTIPFSRSHENHRNGRRRRKPGCSAARCGRPAPLASHTLFVQSFGSSHGRAAATPVGGSPQHLGGSLIIMTSGNGDVKSLHAACQPASQGKSALSPAARDGLNRVRESVFGHCSSKSFLLVATTVGGVTRRASSFHR